MIFDTLSAMKFPRKIVIIRVKTRTKPKIRVDLRINAKSEIEIEPGLLASLSIPLKSANLDCINFRAPKPNAEFLKRFFFHGIILLTLIRFFLK